MLAKSNLFPTVVTLFAPRKQNQGRIGIKDSKCIVYAAKQKPSQKGEKNPKRAPRKFEQLMLDWDDVFDSMCKDSAKAAQMELQAATGYAHYGRGFLLVRSKVVDAPKASTKGSQEFKGFGGQADTPSPSTGTPLLTNPALLELSWSAVYVPAWHLPSLGGTVSQQGVPLPSPSQLVQGPGDTQGEAHGRRVEGGQQDGVDQVVLQDLQRAMRGMDGARLAYLVGMSMEQLDAQAGSTSPSEVPPETPGLTAVTEAPSAPVRPGSEGGGLHDDGSMQAEDTGERPYQPELREFVVLLLANIEKQPAIGADIVMAVGAEDEEGGVQLLLPGLMAFPELA